jgi:hypothetical protein
MAQTSAEKNAEKQRHYKEKMYAEGYKQTQVWVLRDGNIEKTLKGGANAFLRRLDMLTANWSKSKVTQLFEEIIETVTKRNEEARRKKTKKS